MTTIKSKRQLQTERRAEFFNGVNFVYGYEWHNGQKRPTVTVAVVPEMVDGQLYFGIGVSRIAPIDLDRNLLTKANGRARSTARARAVLKMDGEAIFSKPYGAFESTDELCRRVLGMRTNWQEALTFINELHLSDSLTDRICDCMEYLAGKLLPKASTES